MTDFGANPAFVASQSSQQAVSTKGFNPGEVASRLGKRQRAVILSLGEDWGRAACHQTAKRMFWGVQGGFYLVDHKHRTDNCWALTERGLAVKSALSANQTEDKQ